MGSLRARNGMLFFDFRYRSIRCREQTALSDTPGNQRKLTPILERIESAIKLGVFRYEDYFPDSPRARDFADDFLPDVRQIVAKGKNSVKQKGAIPLFREFALTWYEENEIRWRRTYRTMMKGTLKGHLFPMFGECRVDEIDRSDLLKYRSGLGRENEKGKILSSVRINHIITPLKMILSEASIRYSFTDPSVNIRALKVPRSDISPFSLDEIRHFLANIRADFHNYYKVRFFSGLRTAEIDGLQWKYIDFGSQQILVRETLVDYVLDTTKTPGSIREVTMSSPVFEALQAQFKVTGDADKFVFCNRKGNPLRHRDVTKRIWYPTLRLLGLKRRNPYQTRHTAATLWLASGENPEWIARQMGHTTTRMLFTTYSRFVPNLTRNDGSAFESLLAAKLNGDNHDE